MSNICEKILNLAKTNSISNVLFFNDHNLTKQDIIELTQFIPNIYVSYYNAFNLRSLLVQFRRNKQVHILEPSNVPLINYDFISTNEITNPINLLLSKIKSIKFLNVESNVLINTPIGFKQHETYQNLFIKNQMIIIEETTLNNKNFKNEMIEANQNKNNINTRPKNIIIIKNLTSTETNFEFNKTKFNYNNGQLDILCILEYKKDYDKFINVLDFFNKNYKNTKFFVCLVGNTILKYFKESILETFNYILIKTSNKGDVENCVKSFEIFSNGTSIINDFKNIDLNKEILDIINEDCINITNI